MKILVTFISKKFWVGVADTATGLDLRKALHKVCPPCDETERLRLCFDRVAMRHDRKLTEYRIRDGSTVYAMVLRGTT